MTNNRPPVSILLPTYNVVSIVEQTLQSICWADEILVVDSFSNDGTLELCRQYGARIIQHEYINSARQKNWAVAQCTYEWVLQIDTDEVLEDGLREEIGSILTDVTSDVHAFRLPRKNHLMGEWVKYAGLYPDYQTRLFRRDEGRWQDREVHALVVVSGQVRTLKGHILHRGMPTISKPLRNLDRYTRYEADELHKQGRQFRGIYLLLHPWYVFIYRYLWQQGFRAGWRGLIICAYLGMYDFLTYAKLWEMQALQLDRSPK